MVAADQPGTWPPGASGGNPTRISPPGGVAGNPPAWAGGGGGQPGARSPGSPRHGGRGPDVVTLTPRVIELGKWVEGVADDGHNYWVAESGQRTIARVDLASGRVLGRVKVGRLPVSMVSTYAGEVYAMVFTDQTIWQQHDDGRGAVFTKIPDCPQDLIMAGGNLWALTEPDCSSQTSRVIRIDPQTKRQFPSGDLGEWGQALASYDSDIWVGHARAPAISVVDQRSLRQRSIDVPGAEFWAMASDSQHVYGAGRTSGTSEDGLIVMFDPNRLSEVARASVGERVTQIKSDENYVVAAGDKGTIWVFSVTDLTLLRTITLSTGTFEPHALLLADDQQLVISAGSYNGDNGALFVVSNYQPDNGRSFGGGGGGGSGGGRAMVPSQPGLMLSVGGDGPVTDFTLVDDLRFPVRISWIDGQGKEFLAGGGAVSPGQSWRVENGAKGYESHWYSIRTGSRLVCSFALRQGAVVRLSELSACRL